LSAKGGIRKLALLYGRGPAASAERISAANTSTPSGVFLFTEETCDSVSSGNNGDVPVKRVCPQGDGRGDPKCSSYGRPTLKPKSNVFCCSSNPRKSSGDNEDGELIDDSEVE
jgi:hypothetical protein